jgi:hypothetical protein
MLCALIATGGLQAPILILDPRGGAGYPGPPQASPAAAAAAPVESLSSSDKEVGDHLALTLDGHQSPPLEPVAVPQALVGPSGDLDAAGHPERLHPAGGVHGVAPQS